MGVQHRGTRTRWLHMYGYTDMLTLGDGPHKRSILPIVVIARRQRTVCDLHTTYGVLSTPIKNKAIVRRSYSQWSTVFPIYACVCVSLSTHHAVFVYGHSIFLQEVVHVRPQPLLSPFPEQERRTTSTIQEYLDRLELLENAHGREIMRNMNRVRCVCVPRISLSS